MFALRVGTLHTEVVVASGNRSRAEARSLEETRHIEPPGALVYDRIVAEAVKLCQRRSMAAGGQTRNDA